jgi:hypothetical protein
MDFPPVCSNIVPTTVIPVFSTTWNQSTWKDRLARPNW